MGSNAKTVALALALVIGGCRSATPPPPAAAAADENSAPSAWRLVVVGNAALSLGEVLEAVRPEVEALKAGGFRKADLDDLAFEVERAYRERGFAFASTTYEYDVTGARAVVSIDEGPLVELDRVEVEGQSAVSAADVAALFPEKRHGVFGLGGRLYVASDTAGFASSVEDAYIERGFVEVAAEDAEAEFSDDRSRATVRIRVNEGRRYTVAGLLRPEVPEIEPEALAIAMTPFVDAPYVARRGVEIRGAILELYAERGYPKAVVRTREAMSEGNGGVLVWFAVTARPGPKIRIGSVRIEGCDETDPAFVRSRVVFKDGDIYDSRRARQSFRRLFGTGLFKSVDVKLEDGDADSREVVVTVSEGSSLEYFFELGFGSYDLLRAKTGVRDRNLFDSSLIGRAELLGSIRGAQLTLGVTDPWFLRSEWALDLPLKVLRREEPAFTIQEVGLEPRLSRAFTESLTAGWTYRFDLSRVDNLDAAEEADAEANEEERLRVGASGPFAILDDRDNLFAPAAGGVSRAAFELGALALGGEISFAHLTLSTARFLEIFDGTVVAARLETEWIDPLYGTDSIPIQERLFNGGENSVRSFREAELGPKDDDGDPLGGEVRNLASVELRQRLSGDLSFALFWDAGNVAESTTRPFVGFRHAVGPGLRYQLPIGPLRLDVGFNPSPADGEDSYVIQVAVGMPY